MEKKIVRNFVRRLRAKASCCHDGTNETEREPSRFFESSDKCPDGYESIFVCGLQFSSCEECLKKRRQDPGKIGKPKLNSQSLVDLKNGEMGRVVFIRGGYKMIRRLLDMGITPNATIKVIKIAPFRGPVEISVRGSNLALGYSVAANVFVEPVGGASEASDHG